MEPTRMGRPIRARRAPKNSPANFQELRMLRTSVTEGKAAGDFETRERVDAGLPYGEAYGYSRAVKVGKIITVSGTTTAREKSGKLVGENDAYAQTVSALRKIARAHRELFAIIKPASLMVQVTSLIEPEMLVEIEADAILG